MKWNIRPLALAALGVVLMATNALAVAAPITATGPTLTWNTFVGGAVSYTGFSSIAVDPSGNVYVTGNSESTWGSPVRPFGGSRDVFVAKLDANGALLWSTFLGGSGNDVAKDIAIDADGNVLVSGDSTEPWGASILPWPEYLGSFAGFVAKLDTNGALLWNNFLVMVNSQSSVSVAVDASNNVYATGVTWGSWGSPISPWVGGHDAFVAKFDTDGALLWNTFFGLAAEEIAFALGIAVDSGGTISVAGATDSSWGDPIRAWAGARDGFVARLDTNGVFLWNTFFGGAGDDYGLDIAVDTNGSTYVSGWSSSDWGAPVRSWSGGPRDAFTIRLDPSGVLLWNTFLGGDDDQGNGIAIDASGNAYVAGMGAHDATLTKLDANGALMWQTFYGGAGGDNSFRIAIDESGNGYVTGASTSVWGDPISAWVSRASGSSVNAFAAKFENMTDTLPIAADQTLSTPEGTSKAITLSATDFDADLLTYAVVTGPAHGTLGGIPPDLTYQPTAGFTGMDSFTFQANDGWLDSNIATVTISVTADVTPPTGSILINNGAAATNTTAVTLKLLATDTGGSGLASMRFRNRDTDPYGAWEPYLATKAWTLPSELGTRKVFVQFMDLAGNISDANPAAAGVQGYMDAITLNEGIAPTGTIRINNGAASTSTTAVTLNLMATDAGGSGLASMRFRNRDTDPYSAWEPFHATKPWALVGGAGTRKVYAQFRDLAGNVSDANAAVAGAQAYQDSISLNP